MKHAPTPVILDEHEISCPEIDRLQAVLAKHPKGPRHRTQRALSFMGGSVLVTPTHAEFVFREEDLQWDDEPGTPYRWLRIPAGDYQELGEFLTRAEQVSA